jgi:hypothetical protein
LEAPRGQAASEGRSFAETLRDAAALRPDVRFEAADFDSQLRARLRSIEETLVGRDLAIFRRRLLCDEPERLAELAVDFGVSRERTRQIEVRLIGGVRLDLSKGLGDAIVVAGRFIEPSAARLLVQFLGDAVLEITDSFLDGAAGTLRGAL